MNLPEAEPRGILMELASQTTFIFASYSQAELRGILLIKSTVSEIFVKPICRRFICTSFPIGSYTELKYQSQHVRDPHDKIHKTARHQV